MHILQPIHLDIIWNIHNIQRHFRFNCLIAKAHPLGPEEVDFTKADTTWHKLKWTRHFSQSTAARSPLPMPKSLPRLLLLCTLLAPHVSHHLLIMRPFSPCRPHRIQLFYSRLWFSLDYSQPPFLRSDANICTWATTFQLDSGIYVTMKI